jgi:Protein of unknown function (DUF3300)/Chaperone of endosialidase
MFLGVIRLSALGFLFFLPLGVAAQAQSPPAAASGQQLLKSEELDALVAPIALYPDKLLAGVLIASTYPLEVVQADRWVTEHKNLKGERLKAEADKQAWDDSVKSLIATPSVLTMMSTKLDWTQKLGDAFLAQQPDVMDAIQRLRSRAYANNKLTSTKEQNVTVKQEEGKQVIAIEPTTADTIYVPYYDPAVVYGGWPYPDYPPYYFPAPGYIATGIIATGIAFGAGYALGRWAGYWGGRVNWGGNNIDINRGARVSHWQHNPEHRHGVRYNNASVQQRFGKSNILAGSQGRQDFRGRSGEQVLKPGGDRVNLGERGPPSRQSGADRDRDKQANAAKRPSSGARPSSGDRGRGKQAGTAKRPSSGANHPRRDSAFGNIQSGKVASLQSQRGRESLGGISRGGGATRGGGVRAGGGGRGGGRRSDVRLKHDIALLRRLDNGLGLYRFSYNGSQKAYVGVMAQEVQTIIPEAVVRGRRGYLSVFYDKLGLKFQTYDRWIASRAHGCKPALGFTTDCLVPAVIGR